MRWKTALVHQNLALYDASDLSYNLPASRAGQVAGPEAAAINWFSEDESYFTYRTAQNVSPAGVAFVTAHFPHIISLMLPHADHWKPAMRWEPVSD